MGLETNDNLVLSLALALNKLLLGSHRKSLESNELFLSHDMELGCFNSASQWKAASGKDMLTQRTSRRTKMSLELNNSSESGKDRQTTIYRYQDIPLITMLVTIDQMSWVRPTNGVSLSGGSQGKYLLSPTYVII